MDHLFLSDWCYLLRAWPNFLYGSIFLLYGRHIYSLYFVRTQLLPLLSPYFLRDDLTSVREFFLSSPSKFFCCSRLTFFVMTLLPYGNSFSAHLPNSSVALALLSSWWPYFRTGILSQLTFQILPLLSPYFLRDDLTSVREFLLSSPSKFFCCSRLTFFVMTLLPYGNSFSAHFPNSSVALALLSSWWPSSVREFFLSSPSKFFRCSRLTFFGIDT
jgi:hypothetical protein